MKIKGNLFLTVCVNLLFPDNDFHLLIDLVKELIKYCKIFSCSSSIPVLRFCSDSGAGNIVRTLLFISYCKLPDRNDDVSKVLIIYYMRGVRPVITYINIKSSYEAFIRNDSSIESFRFMDVPTDSFLKVHQSTQQ